MNTVHDKRPDPEGAPIISVVVPNYNHAEYLQEILTDLLAQSRPIDEIIFVDDGSTDGSRAILQRFADHHPAVRLISHDVNRGVNAAIRTGLEAARGRYVHLRATNDIMGKHFIRVSVDLLEAHPEAAICFGNPAWTDATGARRTEVSLFLRDIEGYLDPNTISRQMALKAFTIPGDTTVFRRKALLAIGGFRPELRWHADWFANLGLMFRHGACYTNAHLSFYRIHEGAYSDTRIGDWRGEREILETILVLLETPEFADVHARLRRSGILPLMRLRAVGWLLPSPPGRRYLTFRLGTRCLLEEAWHWLRPVMPISLRQVARRMTSHRWAVH